MEQNFEFDCDFGTKPHHEALVDPFDNQSIHSLEMINFTTSLDLDSEKEHEISPEWSIHSPQQIESMIREAHRLPLGCEFELVLSHDDLYEEPFNLS